MNQLYFENTANYPRLATDRFFADYDNNYMFNGFVDKSIRFVEEFQLLQPELWKRFANQFHIHSDEGALGWRGEFWGKMMRGACFTYSYTRNEELYTILIDTVKDVLSSQEENGRISSYEAAGEFDGWDLWGRKYILLGMQYFLEICKDEKLTEEIVASMCGQVDYLIERIGPENEGKLPITFASKHLRGLNSSSILEPVVRLYNITKLQKYLDFATYIVSCGGTQICNVFDLAYENKICPYQYPITKAYELISCFEGLLEYYRVTGNEHYKKAVINFADRILESDFTVIGSSGCTHELFDHSTVRQANTTNGNIAQETCVTVTLMKFLYQMTLLTGKSKYVDAFEISMYNAYFGAINTEKLSTKAVKKEYPKAVVEPMPFDSYSPLTADVRGKAVGGLRLMPDNHYYGCCACIGSAGNGLLPKMALLTTVNGFAYNLFIDGTVQTKTPSGNTIEFQTNTNYPVNGNVEIKIKIGKSEKFELLIRNPEWSKTTKLKLNGVDKITNDGYLSLNRKWENGDTVEIEFDMRVKAILPVAYEPQILMNNIINELNYVVSTYDEQDPIALNHIALQRGPIVLAQENRLGYNVDEPVAIAVGNDGYVDALRPQKDIAPYEHIIEMNIPLKDGGFMTVTDYASAGKTWTEESKMAAWMLTK